MTIELVEKEYSVDCDICGKFCEGFAFVGPKEGKREARRYFSLKGWSFNGYGEAICPKCANEMDVRFPISDYGSEEEE